ncbi:MAG: ADOP family duplicated permease [Terriglobia bacterium]
MSWTRFFRRRYWDEERARELEAYLEAETDDNIARGMSPEDARYAAHRKLGNTTLIREEIYSMNSLGWLETLSQDLRFALRTLRKNPGFTAVAAMTLALGIGSCTAIFTVVNSVLLQPLPYPHSEQLFLIQSGTPGGSFGALTDVEFSEYEKQSQAFEHLAAFSAGIANLTGAGDPVVVHRCEVTPGFWPTMGVAPELGRTFAPGSENGPGRDSVVLSDRVWRAQFHADPGIVGKSVTLDGTARTVVGVMPTGFDFPAEQGVWSLASLDPLKFKLARQAVIGRLRPSTSTRQAQAEMDVISRQLFSVKDRGKTLRLFPLYEYVVGDVGRSLLVLLGAVGFILLIACANVANLLLARGLGRRQEMAIRTSLGAGRFRLIRQLLCESVTLSFLGGALGMLMAAWGVRVFLSLVPSGDVPRLREIHLDARVLAFAVLVSVLTGVIFGLAPAVHLSGISLNQSLQQAGSQRIAGGGQRLKSVLVVAELALALILLIGAGLLIKSFVRLRSVNPGFLPEHVLTMTVFPPQHWSLEQLKSFHQQVLEKLETLPEIESAAAVNWLPFGHATVATTIGAEGQDIFDQTVVCRVGVSQDYFQTIGIRLLRGRYFNVWDNQKTSQVAIVSRATAERVWPDESALGKRVYFKPHPGPQDWLTVVGVVEDVRQQSLAEPPRLTVYEPYLQVSDPVYLSNMVYLVRTRGNPTRIAALMRGRLHEVDRDQPAYAVEPLQHLINRSVAEPRFYSKLLGIISAAAMLIAAVGMYGVAAFSVSQRTREIGIRMALGAERANILRMVLQSSLRLISVGLALGLCGGAAVTRVLQTFLFEVKPTDAATFAAVAALLAAVALLATYIPARRATKVDPIVALRYE